ncbi:hypothetical protein ENHAE0001_2143 [Enhydrobacter aerosaccus SK60]|nr:hypothetical protein ENHAE0001_2143 [Enhydrobacter aerosaccus SK60]
MVSGKIEKTASCLTGCFLFGFKKSLRKVKRLTSFSQAILKRWCVLNGKCRSRLCHIQAKS